jgi:hypothetical protein
MSVSTIRAYKINIVSASCTLGPGSNYPKAWGIMRGEGNPSGSLLLQGGGSLNLVSIDNHQIFPCYPAALQNLTGSVIVLS